MEGAENIIFNCKIFLNNSGIMTLNGLNNGYKSPPSSGYENPQVVLSFIQGPDTVTAIQSCGGNHDTTDGGTSYSGYGSTIKYNLPDGSLLTIKYSIYYKPFTGFCIDDQLQPQLSANSLFEITKLQYSASEQTGFTLSFTVQQQQN
jgi:hypothetical protein